MNINTPGVGLAFLNLSNVSGSDIKIENTISEWAIYVAINSVADLVNVSLKNGAKDGVYVSQNSSLKLNNSEISGFGNAGVRCDYYSNSYPRSILDIQNSVIKNNKYGIHSFYCNDTIKNNVIIGNPSYGLFNVYNSTFNAVIVDAKSNYWGDSTGPYHPTLNSAGLGNAVSNGVNFIPFLTSDPTTTPPVCTVDCFSNVLFLPGLKASRLYEKRADGSEDQLWEPNANSDVEDLYLNTDGTSKNLSIYTRDIIKETNTPIPTGPLGQNIYKSFSSSMDQLITDQKIKEWRPFAYDWRQSPDDVVNTPQKYNNNQNISLVSTLQSLITSSKNGKVTIIAHSNGGLVAKALLKKLQDDKLAGRNNLIDSVDVLVLVAVPQIGTAEAVPAILHGYDQQILGGWLMDETHARELGRNMPSAYGLLPSREYINRVSASPVTFVDTAIPSNVTTKLVQAFGSAIDSYIEYKNFLFGTEGRTDPLINQTNLPISLSQNLFSKAENLHNSIDTWTPPASLRVIEVAGWGLDTIASFEYFPKYSCAGSLSECKFILDERPRFTPNGDKTVVVPSAQYMSSLGSAEKYWVDLPRHNEQLLLLRKNREHADIFEVAELVDFLRLTLTSQTLISNNVIKSSQPTDTKNRLRLSVHSPVTIDAYDAEGNHTGKICPPTSDFCYAEENIPNSSYLEFGEGKYINLPEDQMLKVKLQGTDVGTFTYESQKVMPNGTSGISSFVDIPVTTQTQAEITLNQNGAPELALDVTGDGVIDFILAPNSTFNPIAYLQIMKATINSLDLPQSKKNAFNNRVDNIIRAIEEGKINKAVLRADKFKSALEKKLAKPDPKKLKPKKLSKADAQLLLAMLDKLLDNLK